MPIYEFACPKCRMVYSFLSKRINPDETPNCPKCGSKKLTKQMSQFAMTKGGKDDGGDGSDEGMPNFDDPRVMRAMQDIEKDMAGLDENNPRHMAHVLIKMKDMMPSGALPKEFDMALKRLESGEDPEKIEEDMGDVLGDLMGGDPSGGGGGENFGRDPNLYDY